MKTNERTNSPRQHSTRACQTQNFTPELKTKNSKLKILGFAFALLTAPALAQTWQTVDAFQYVPNGSAQNWGLTVAPSGVIYACGRAGDASGQYHALIMASTDDGNTWSAPLDDFHPSTSDAYTSIISDPAGNLYAAGYYNLNVPILRRSGDAGRTWATVFDGLAGDPWCSSKRQTLVADQAGNIYWAASPGGSTWAVMKGIGGTNYSTVDAFTNNGAQAFAVFVHPTAGIFAAGKGGSEWLVRHSTDSGATWTDVDTFALSGGTDACALGIGADVFGNIYAVGHANEAVYLKKNSYIVVAHWIVRKSSNGGLSWTTVDDYAPYAVNGFGQGAWGFAADVYGNLFVAGADNGHWLVRESVGGTGSWTTVDDFTGGSSAAASAIATDSLGNVFVGGSAGTTNQFWTVRKN